MPELRSKERLWASRRLVQIGARLPEKPLHRLNRIVNYLEAGRWMARHGYPLHGFDANRTELFERIAAQIGASDVLYLEFGVAEGDSLRHWSELLRNPSSSLHGFDSFEGLPTSWPQGGGMTAGAFSRAGVAPHFADRRVVLHQGWFEDTLPGFDWPEHDVLVANIDSDLYTSAVTALTHLEAHLRVGSFLYFDEFHHRGDELRAFDEFLVRTGMRFELVGATPQLMNVMFRRVG